MMKSHGFAGKIADRMIDSPIIPIILIAALLMGGYGLLLTPREDRPEIEVPTAVIVIPFPGGDPDLIDELVARPVSSWALQLERVEEVRSVSSNDAAMVSIEFSTGVSDAEAFSELNDLMSANRDKLPAGTGNPEIRTIGDEQISTLMFTLSAHDMTATNLRSLSEELAFRLEEVPGVRSVNIFGGEPRQVQVMPDPQALEAHNIDLLTLVEAVTASGLRLPGDDLRGDTTTDVRIGAVLSTVGDLRQIQVGVGPAGIVYLDDVADIHDGPAPAESHVVFWSGESLTETPAVSLAVTTVPLENISRINEAVLDRLESLQGVLIPNEVNIHIGYDAGQDATERVRNVLRNLLTAMVVVVFIILVGLGRRAALTISMMIPAALSFVPLAYYWTGFTLNPVSIAAMILAIGIVSDDSVIMLENTARHFQEHGRRSRELVVKAVDEVGNPTILAVILIIATILPTAFITGEMGQFVRVIPVGASIAIFASLCLALAVIPYLALRLLTIKQEKGDERNGDDKKSRLEETYRRVLTLFMNKPPLRWLLYVLMVVLLAGSVSLVYFRAVPVGLAPYLDREVFVLDIRLPPGTPLEKTLRATSAIGRELRKEDGVTGYTVFAGTDGPQLYPPPEPMEIRPLSTNRAYVYVHLSHKDERGRMSYDIGQGLYDTLGPQLDRLEARMIVRRIPSGPSKEEDIHAELYGPTETGRFSLAQRVAALVREHPATAVTRQTPEPHNPLITFDIDRTSASAFGVSPAEVARTFHIALSGMTASVMHMPTQRHPVPVVVRLSPDRRERIEQLEGLYLRRGDGGMIPMSDIVVYETISEPLDFHRKNLLPVVYVAGKIDRGISEPLGIQQDISGRLRAGDHEAPLVSWFSQPRTQDRYVLHWGGEWEMTQQAYRDLGIAALVVVILIYTILAAWFHSYGTPLMIMLPIPLVLIGVIPAHWLWGLSIAGVGIMGVITLAGIVVRNAVLLVDFIENRRKDGMPLDEAVIRAGVLRTRPIVLTASTVMFGSGVLILEPALEPLGLTLASGVLVSTVLTLLLIPVLYYHAFHKKEDREEKLTEDPGGMGS